MKRSDGITYLELELSLARRFCCRRNYIVPNCFWGAGLRHEADFMIVSKSGYGKEIEIKFSIADIKKDLSKRFSHYESFIREVWFCIPEEFWPNSLIPDCYGVITFKRRKSDRSIVHDIVRSPKINTSAVPMDEKKINHFLHLGCMRIFSLKQKILKLELKNEKQVPAM